MKFIIRLRSIGIFNAHSVIPTMTIERIETATKELCLQFVISIDKLHHAKQILCCRKLIFQSK